MPILSQTKIIPYSAKQIYNLVMDIEKYPEFLPWCKQAKIVTRISDRNLQADLLINFKNFFEKYRSDVTHCEVKEENGSAYCINAIAINGPFKNLLNQWKISEVETNRCRVDFLLEFEFNSIILGKMIGLVFESAAEKMIAAFEDRAREVYSK